MEPRIQYAQASDGVSIAYAIMGDGYPLIYMPIPLASHVQLEWESPLRSRYEHFAAKFQLVRFDPRGIGLSDRAVDDFSLEARVGDLEAVISKLECTRFALAGQDDSGALAVSYAVRHPEKVSHLILVDAYSRSADQLEVPQVEGVMELLSRDWEMFTETAAGLGFGWGREEARQMGELFRACITQETAQKLLSATASVDVTELLSGISAPTLVMTHGVRVTPIDLARRLASHIPKARMVVLNGNWVDTAEDFVRAIDEFLSEGEETEPKTELPEGMAVILFADIVESTALTERLGDAAFRAKARELDEALRNIIGECSGTPVEGKLVGDGVLAVFTSARHAIECALRCNGAGESVGLQLHLGIHAGDVIREGNNVYGGAVNIAARIAGESAPGEVLVSDTVRGLARTSAGVSFDDHGEQSLKGIEDPQRLFVVQGGTDG